CPATASRRPRASSRCRSRRACPSATARGTARRSGSPRRPTPSRSSSPRSAARSRSRAAASCRQTSTASRSGTASSARSRRRGRAMNLSQLLFRNLGTKLLALAIACATWYILTGQRRERISERNYRIPLSIVNVPAGTMVVSPLPDSVDVRVRGAFTPLRALEPSKLEALVDLVDAVPGEKRYPLGPGDINVPSDIEVIAISPAEIRLVLDA